MCNRLGEYNQAKELHEKALTIRKKIVGEDHADLASSYNNLASVYYRLGEYNQPKNSGKVWFSSGWGTKEAENVFLTHGWEYGFECARDLYVTLCFRVQLFLLPSAIAYLLFVERFLRSLFLSFFCNIFW